MNNYQRSDLPAYETAWYAGELGNTAQHQHWGHYKQCVEGEDQMEDSSDEFGDDGSVQCYAEDELQEDPSQHEDVLSKVLHAGADFTADSVLVKEENSSSMTSQTLSSLSPLQGTSKKASTKSNKEPENAKELAESSSSKKSAIGIP